MKSIYIFILGLFITIAISGSAFAKTTYTVKKGDNPTSIAKKFNVSAKSILQANAIKSTNLKPGSKITIPSNKKEALRKNKADAKDIKKTANNIKPLLHEDSSYHIVKKGDTLMSIGRKYSIAVRDIKEINELNSAKLRVGQKLVLKKTVPDEYIVRKGDTVWNIAKRFNIDPQELMNNNGLESDSLIAGHTVLLKAATGTSEPRIYDTILSQAPVETTMESAPETSTLSEMDLQDRLVLFAKKMLNIPYRFGGNTLVGIDCSAYVKKVYSLVGVSLPRSAREQFAEGKPVDNSELSMGDLVFFKTYAAFPSHVGIYLGDNLFIHASSRSKKVTIDSLETPYYIKRFIGAKRLIEGKNEQETTGQKS
jgi:peptidoglycan DL-endopeptidase LytE